MSKAINDSSIITSTLKVSGLDCPDCAKDVQKAVTSIPGVQSAVVNFGAQKLKVVYTRLSNCWPGTCLKFNVCKF